MRAARLVCGGGRVLLRRVDPSDHGWSADALAAAGRIADGLDTYTAMLVVGGDVIWSRGDLARKLPCHSMRKSFLSALYGTAVARGEVRLDATLGELGIDDLDPLSEQEKSATVRDLLRARSGVYRPALAETEEMAALRPAPGQYAPGVHWYYNNWDFNCLGHLLEQRTGEPLGRTFEQRIAQPIGMEDFVADDVVGPRHPERTHPVHHYLASTRDVARFALLYLRRGLCDGAQVLRENWVDESTRMHSETEERGGYGYLWWVAVDGRHLPGVAAPAGTYSAWGYHGHFAIVVPSLDMVFVHRVDTTDPGNCVEREQFGPLLGAVLSAAPSSGLGTLR